MTTIEPIILNPEQEDARAMVLNAVAQGADASLLGIAGSGKTTVGAESLKQFPPEVTVCAVAPTHTAATVLRGHLRAAGLKTPVHTIHSTVFKPKFKQPLLDNLAAWLRDTRSKPGIPARPHQWILDIIAPGLEIDDPRISKRVHDFVAGANTDLEDGDMVSRALTEANQDSLLVLLEGWVPRTEPLADVLIADEASMVSASDANVMRGLCKSLILTGDPMQLPKVDPDNEGIPVPAALDPDYLAGLGASTVLIQNMRTEGDGGRQIAEIGSRLREVATDPDFTFDIFWEGMERRAAEPDSAISLSHEWPLSELLNKAPAIFWRNAPRYSLNARIREAIGFSPSRLYEGERLIVSGSDSFTSGVEDPLKLLIPNSMWRVEKVASDKVTLADIDGRLVKTPIKFRLPHDDQLEKLDKFDSGSVPLLPVFEYGSWGRFAESAWGVTCHKMQGSEADHVCIAWYDLMNLCRRCPEFAMRKGADGIPFWIKWVYTAITRAKKKVTLVTSRNLSEEPPEVIERALFNSRTPRKLVF